MTHPLFEARLDQLEIAVFDLETTGLYASRDRIIQVAVVPFANNTLENEGWSQLVHPGESHLPLRTLIEDLTGIKTEQVSTAPPLRTVIEEFDQRVGTRVIAGHNIRAFDIKFLRKAERTQSIDLQLDYYVDTIVLMRKMHPELTRFNLRSCADFYGIEYDPSKLHDALYDTQLTARLLRAQIDELSGNGVNTFEQYLSLVG